MSVTKPSLPKGVRDFDPDTMQKRDYILNTIREVFFLGGFTPLETPAMENLSVLTGKYGEEGDQLLFRILNSGDFLKKTQTKDYEAGSTHLSAKIAEKGLRYDLTVPFARHVAMNRGTITFPFRRYQIQPVWRADRPQKGRYREFYQCDADVIGTRSLICEAELVWLIQAVLDRFGLSDFEIRINHRDLLSRIASYIGAEKENEFFVSLDKLDKIGKKGVFSELSDKGLNAGSLNKLENIFNINGSNYEIIKQLESAVGQNESTDDLKKLLDYISLAQEVNEITIDPSLARGLAYYTGIIFEVMVNNVNIGSICGGGRYDDLTGVFGLKDISGVGISFGVERIYDVLDELKLFPSSITQTTKVLITYLDNESKQYGLKVLTRLREKGIPSEIYPDTVKLKKQLTYANKKSIPFVIVIGPDETKSGKLALKDMVTGKQENISTEEIADRLK